MSIVDRLAAKIMPPESAEDRANARRTAQSLTNGNDWFGIVLDQHKQIEELFQRALTSGDARTRNTALKDVQTLLTGHANAEEAVLYPALVDHDEKSHATMSYEEHAMARIQLGLLETIDPMSQEWREKLEHVRGAVLHHMYAEEGTRFAKLQESLPPSERERLTQRFLEEFERYAGRHQAEQPRQMAAQQSSAAGLRQQETGGPQPGDLPPHMGAADY
jgi:hemerythrin superfamily protein